MRVAVLSGKGGTGKTFVSTNLASVIKEATYVDCDVEEPNGHLFYLPTWTDEEVITRRVPSIDAELCKGCRTCTDFCKFHALAYVGGEVKVFDSICHSCGGCSILCPTNACTEVEHPIGKVKIGTSLDTKILTGVLYPSEPSGVLIIQWLLQRAATSSQVIYDCPPGSSCTVIESIRDADYCLLVAESTRFGCHNLSMVHNLVKLFKKPYGVILNKSTTPTNPSKEYCMIHHIPILEEIPYDKKLGDLLSNGKLPSRENDDYRRIFIRIRDRLIKEVAHEAIACT